MSNLKPSSDHKKYIAIGRLLAFCHWPAVLTIKSLQWLSWLTFVSWPSHSQTLLVDVCLPVCTAVGESLDLTERPIQDLGQVGVLHSVSVHLGDVEQVWAQSPLYSSSSFSIDKCP